MATLPYGKRMLKASLDSEKANVKKAKRLSPDEDARYWCQSGLDKDWFKVQYISDYKGYGVFAEKNIRKGDFLLEYVGERIGSEEADRRQKKFSDNKVFYFCYDGKTHCIDASGTQGHICQLVNDGHGSAANAVMKFKHFGHERLCLYALKDIKARQEIVYDYGDRNNLWWRNEKTQKHLSDSEDSDPFGLDDKDNESDTDSSLKNDSEHGDSHLFHSESKAHTQQATETRNVIDVVEDSNHSSIDSEHGDSHLFHSESKAHTQQATETRNVIDVVEDSNHSSIGAEHGDFHLFQLEDFESPPSKANKQQTRNDIDVDSNHSSIVPVYHFPALEQSILNTSEQSTEEKANNQAKSNKPDRYCIYCNNVIKGGKLARHIKRKHKHENDVKEILNKSKSEQNNFFEKKRREGMYKYNVNALAVDGEPTMRERQPRFKDELRVCGECKCFISNKYFSKHKCSTQKPTPLKPRLLKCNEREVSSDLQFSNLLNRFRDGEVGDLCRTNSMIKQIGYRHFNLRRHEQSKQDEVRKVVMGEMRELARLFLEFRRLTTEDITVEEMFSRQYLPELREAIENLTRVDNEDKTEKHGLKLMLDAIILRSIKALSGYFSETMQDQKYKEMKMLKTAYQYRSNEMYSRARQQCVVNSKEKSRRPEQLPLEWDIKKINIFLNAEITHAVQQFTIEKYAWLRSLLVTRLTLYNARRGEEPSRMLVKELEDAFRGTWLPSENVEGIQDEGEKFLLDSFKLAYIGGKGRKFVPVLVPNNLLDGLSLILKHRLAYGVPDTNMFVFASKASMSHCSGWHALREICDRVGVDVAITATKNRHRLSTLYTSLDMREEDRKVFLEHMGHGDSINKENYQCPLGLRTVSVMGKVLATVDTGKVSSDKDRKNSEQEGMKEVETSIDTASSVRTKFKHGKEEIESSSDADRDDFSSVEDQDEYYSEKKRRNSSAKWSKEDTLELRSYFQTWIDTEFNDNKGNLPSKDKIMEYLRRCQPKSLSALGSHQRYIKTRTKLFNERKTLRTKARGKLKKITVNSF